MPLFEVVVPTSGRPSLRRLLRALKAGGAAPGEVIVVADGDFVPETGDLGGVGARVLRSQGRGPAAARNTGWRAASAEWVAFLDDDVVPPPEWRRRLARDLEAAPEVVGGSQGRVRVPLPPGRRPTDRERNVRGLESAVWATADMAYRRAALASVGGFDERFPRAYREDADLGLRITRRGWAIARGDRWIEHPVAPAGVLASVRQQAGNADDVTMLALHGPGWRRLCGVPPGRRPRNLAVAAAAAGAVAAWFCGRPRLAAGASVAYVAGVAELAAARIAPGPRDLREIATMTATSALLPVACAVAWLSGWVRLPWLLRRPGPRPESLPLWGPDAAAPLVSSEAAAR